MRHRRHPALTLPRKWLAAVIGIAILQSVTLAAFLLLIRYLVDALDLPDTSLRSMGGPLMILLGLVGANTMLRAADFWASENMGYELVRRLRIAMYGHLQGMPPRRIQRHSRGGLLLRFTGDLSMLRTWVSRGIGRGLSSLIIATAGIAVVTSLNLRMGLLMLSVLTLGTAFLVQLGPRLRRVTKWVRKKRSLLTSNVDEQINSLAVVQAHGRTSGEFSRLSRQNDSLTRTLFETSRIRGRMLGLASGTGWLAIVVLVAVGVVEVTNGRATVGTVTIAVLTARHLVGPVRRISLSYDYWQRARVSRDKILDFLTRPSRELHDTKQPPLRVRGGQIELRGLEVADALHGVSGTIESGQIVAIMGDSGAGKSTLLAVLSGLEELDAGEILVDGQPVSERRLASRMRRFGVVSPDLPLMRGTLRRNLTYRERAASQTELDFVIENCRLRPLVDSLPDGLDTWLIEGGRNLSAGERQRICLARALLGNPPFLLLDEPTVSLDEGSKEVVRSVIRRHLGTVLLVTHDPTEASLADKVWIMHEGRLLDEVPADEFRDGIWFGRQANDALL